MKLNEPEYVNPLAAGRPAWNPYRYAAYLIRERLKWDLQPEAYRSRHVIRQWQDRYRGQKAVIICNGPSLLATDFDSLKGVFTFGLNKINLLFDRSNFRPSCIVSVNGLVLEQNAEFFNSTEIPLFLDKDAKKWIKPRPAVALLDRAPYLSFARDCSISVYPGYTVTYVALQLAFHMGFSNVALIGCDHNFAAKGTANKTVVSGSEDKSHFDPRYFSGGVKWQLPDLAQSEISYALANEVFAAHGREVVNATQGGKLDIFRRERLDSFLTSGQRP